MRKSLERITSLIMVSLMLLTCFCGCGKKKEDSKDNPTGTGTATATESPKSGKTKVVRIGTHVQKGPAPLIKPEIQAGLERAANACKEKMNVKIETVAYKQDVIHDILKSVLAGDPLCDIAVMSFGFGTVIGQNVLQPLDKYADMFKDPEYSWMFVDKIYGHNYLIATDKGFANSEALVYNINYIKKVDALKENGKVVMPTDLWKQGRWTWSAFEDYLSKLDAYYANKKSPVLTDVTISAYKTDPALSVVSLIKTRGSSIMGENGVNLDGEDVKKSFEFMERLVDKKLMVKPSWFDGDSRGREFRNGTTVFADLSSWQQAKSSPVLAGRGEAMGVVPYPRPDDIPEGDPRYQQLYNIGGSVGIVKGIGSEQTDLAIKTCRLYYSEMFKGRYNTESVVEYFNNPENAKAQAIISGLDATNEEYGEDMVEAYRAYSKNLKQNEFYKGAVWSLEWDKLARDAVWGDNGVPEYSSAIAVKKEAFEQQTKDIEALLNTDKIKDNIAPQIKFLGKSFAFPKGTDITKTNWSEYVEAVDNIDGTLDISKVVIDASKVKSDTVGFYKKCLVMSVKDKENNEGKGMFDVVIFDPDNKEVPTLVAKEKYREIKLNEDVSKVNWGKDFVEKAQSADGFDIKGMVTADVSTLDVTKSGKYDVTLTATDYAGNKTELKIAVTVGAK